jgi:hypothetical protein
MCAHFSVTVDCTSVSMWRSHTSVDPSQDLTEPFVFYYLFPLQNLQCCRTVLHSVRLLACRLHMMKPAVHWQGNNRLQRSSSIIVVAVQNTAFVNTKKILANSTIRSLLWSLMLFIKHVNYCWRKRTKLSVLSATDLCGEIWNLTVSSRERNRDWIDGGDVITR